MFRFYKTILNLKTRLLEQNLKKILIFFHYMDMLPNIDKKNVDGLDKSKKAIK